MKMRVLVLMVCSLICICNGTTVTKEELFTSLKTQFEDSVKLKLKLSNDQFVPVSTDPSSVVQEDTILFSMVKAVNDAIDIKNCDGVVSTCEWLEVNYSDNTTLMKSIQFTKHAIDYYCGNDSAFLEWSVVYLSNILNNDTDTIRLVKYMRLDVLLRNNELAAAQTLLTEELAAQNRTDTLIYRANILSEKTLADIAAFLRATSSRSAASSRFLFWYYENNNMTDDAIAIGDANKSSIKFDGRMRYIDLLMTRNITLERYTTEINGVVDGLDGYSQEEIRALARALFMAGPVADLSNETVCEFWRNLDRKVRITSETAPLKSVTQVKINSF